MSIFSLHPQKQLVHEPSLGFSSFTTGRKGWAHTPVGVTWETYSSDGCHGVHAACSCNSVFSGPALAQPWWPVPSYHGLLHTCFKLWLDGPERIPTQECQVVATWRFCPMLSTSPLIHHLIKWTIFTFIQYVILWLMVWPYSKTQGLSCDFLSVGACHKPAFLQLSL